MRRSCMVFGVALLGAGCITEDAGTLATIYGRLKTDVCYDTELTNSNGNFVQYVSDSPSGGDRLAITARETRLGVKLKHGEDLTAKIEFDLYGGGAGGTAENKPTVLLRHAFAKVKLAEGLSVVAGQTGDVYSPILPAVLNYGWGWNCGNTGYRRPQVRVEYAKAGIIGQVAAARAIGGEVSGNADLQARVAYELRPKDEDSKSKVVVGGSIVQGTRDVTHDDEVYGWAVDLDVVVWKLILRGEVFGGKNLSSYLGGIGQTLNDNGEEINTTGMWLQVGFKVVDGLTINGGYMFDDPDQDDLTGLGLNDGVADAIDNRDKNEAWFANVRWKLNKDAELGVEVSGWTTTYWDGTVTTDYSNTRVQTSLIFTF